MYVCTYTYIYIYICARDMLAHYMRVSYSMRNLLGWLRLGWLKVAEITLN